MYTQHDAALLRQRFWLSFGKYMAPIPSSAGEKVNWINYRTGIKYISFRADAGAEGISIAIELSHKDSASRLLYYNHFKTFKKALEGTLSEKWEWQLDAADDNGNAIARIYTALKGVSVYNEKDWPEMISFFKKRLLGLDDFWNDYKDIFEMLT